MEEPLNIDCYKSAKERDIALSFKINNLSKLY